MIWKLNGTLDEQARVREALALCDFPFELLAPSLAAEGKTSIAVDWQDLSRYAAADDTHNHNHGYHALERMVDGRRRVLGLFYLPPHTRIVLDTSLVNDPALAHEVFLAEGAHAVDYHYMTNAQRLVVWNALHASHEDLPDTATVHESGDLHHGHSWFDGPAGYSTWVGEAFMEAFTRAFAPAVPITIQLAHPTSPEAAHEIRHALHPEPHGPEPVPEPVPTPPTPPAPPPPQQDPTDVKLAAALRRYLSRRFTVSYLRTAAKEWLAAHPEL